MKHCRGYHVVAPRDLQVRKTHGSNVAAIYKISSPPPSQNSCVSSQNLCNRTWLIIMEGNIYYSCSRAYIVTLTALTHIIMNPSVAEILNPLYVFFLTLHLASPPPKKKGCTVLAHFMPCSWHCNVKPGKDIAADTRLQYSSI